MKKTVYTSFLGFMFVFALLLFIQGIYASDESPVGFDYTIEEGELFVDIVNGLTGATVLSPSVNFGEGAFSSDPIVAEGTLGSDVESVRVFNYTSIPSWTLNLAADNVESPWSSLTDSYAYNHATDPNQGRLTVNPAIGSILSDVGCNITELSPGSLATFQYGVVDSIDLLFASADAPSFCRFDLRNVTMNQIVPGAQPVGTYTLGMVLTVSANVFEAEFNCGDNLADGRDSNTYSTVEIGTQCWMAENLAYLPAVHDDLEFETQGVNEEPGYGVYGYEGSDVATAIDEANYATYGALYNWYAVNQAGVCPTGWSVPTETDWTTLGIYLTSDSQYWCGGSSGNIGKSLASTTLWETSTTVCAVGNDQASNNSSGFNARPGGTRFDDGWFGFLGEVADFWSSSPSGNLVSSSHLDSTSSEFMQGLGFPGDGFSVRCLKD